MIELKHLSYSYDDRVKILDDISLKIGADNHKVIGFMGHNGAGKSTLFLNLVGELKPTSGEILIDGEPVEYSKKGLLGEQGIQWISSSLYYNEIFKI